MATAQRMPVRQRAHHSADASEVLERIARAGGRAIAVAADLMDASRVPALFDAADADTPPSLAEVARKVGLSSGALGKRFLAELGVKT